MPLTNSAAAYGSVTKTFHWLTALLILTAIPLGWFANQMPIDPPETLAQKAWLFSVHKTVGIAAFAVAVARILWTLTQPKPGLPHPERRLESFAAATVHWLLYASLVIVPLSGWLHHAAAAGFAPILWPFGQGLPLVPQNDAVASFFSGWHIVFTKVLGIAVLLHIAGALKHAVIDRDGTLARMLPGARAGAEHHDHGGRSPIIAAIAIWAVAIAGGSALGLAKTHVSAAPAPQVALPETGTGNWVVESGSVGLTVINFGNAVSGSFADWTARIVFDPTAPPEKMGEVEVQIAVPSLSLGSVTQQALGAQYFNAEAHPTASWRADITGAPGGTYTATGPLRLAGGEAPVTLAFTLEIDGETAQMRGTTQIDRRSFQIGEGSDEATLGFGVDVAVEVVATRTE